MGTQIPTSIRALGSLTLTLSGQCQDRTKLLVTWRVSKMRCAGQTQLSRTWARSGSQKAEQLRWTPQSCSTKAHTWLDLHRHLWPGPQGTRSRLWGGSGGCREAGSPDVLLFTGQFQAHRTRHLAVRDHRCWVQSCTLTAHPRGWENQIAAQVQNNDAWSWREGSVTFYRILRKSGPFS